MGQPNSKSKPKPSLQRGTKLFLAALSVAATLSGWAWLTRGAALDTNPREPIQEVQTVDLTNLPVRGLRQVGDAAVPRAGTQMSAPADLKPSQPQVKRKTRSSK